MGNTKLTLGEKINYEVSTVEPRLSFSPELISKDLAKASEVTEVKFPRVPFQLLSFDSLVIRIATLQESKCARLRSLYRQ